MPTKKEIKKRSWLDPVLLILSGLGIVILSFAVMVILVHHKESVATTGARQKTTPAPTVQATPTCTTVVKSINEAFETPTLSTKVDSAIPFTTSTEVAGNSVTPGHTEVKHLLHVTFTVTNKTDTLIDPYGAFAPSIVGASYTDGSVIPVQFVLSGPYATDFSVTKLQPYQSQNFALNYIDGNKVVVSDSGGVATVGSAANEKTCGLTGWRVR